MTITYPRKIWIVRHAEREDNVNRHWRKLEGADGLASDNSMLSTRGKQQAKECKNRFKNAQIAHCFASPFDRTIETASTIIEDKNLKVKAEGGLCEALYLCEKPPGFWETEQLAEKFPLVDKDYVPVYSRYTLPKEACGDDACVKRVGDTLRKLFEKFEGNLLLVGHGASIGACHEILMGDFKYDLEREERKNLGSGNKEYEAEKAQEKREWESKMGIQVYFADGTNDLTKKKEWYEEMPLRRMGAEPISKKRTSGHAEIRMEDDKKERKRKRNSESDEEEETQRKRHKKDKKHKKKKKRRHHRDSSEERRLEEEYDREKKQKLAKLRDERLKRERIEKGREYALLHPKEVEKKKKEEENERKNGKPRYNSQFNPEFFRK
ncbi:unnamed protein product [Caenorhabditis nigoni]